MKVKVRNHPCEVRDLSATGIGLKDARIAWTESSVVTLELEFSSQAVLTVKARVMWVRGTDLGLKFEPT